MKKKLISIISLAILVVFELVAILVFAHTVPAGTQMTWTNNDPAIQSIIPNAVGGLTWG